jgi:hypothetical protein
MAQADKAAADRERALRERAAFQQELASAMDARDNARADRNAWLTRARAAEDERGRAAAAPAREHKPAEAPPLEAAPDPDPLPPLDPDPLPLAGEQRSRLRRRPPPNPLPPGGILLPPTGPGSNRRSPLPEWAPRVLVPLALVFLVVLVALLIAWAF